MFPFRVYQCKLGLLNIQQSTDTDAIEIFHVASSPWLYTPQATVGTII